MYFENATGGYEWDASKIKDAHAWCKSQVSSGMSEETSYIWFPAKGATFHDWSKIFVANTFTQELEMEGYYELAAQYGYMVVSLICENRHGGTNLHNVPEEKIRQMEERFQIKL